MAFLRSCYHQILGPLLHLPKFANGLCRYSDTTVHLDSHLIWQATKSYVECGGVFGLVSHESLRHQRGPACGRITYAVWYCAIASTARVRVLLGCRSSSRIVK
jgi:hypothetical protein